MHTTYRSKIVLVALTATVAFSSVSEARSRTRSGQVQTSRGRTGTVVENTQRERGELHRDRTLTGENGRIATQTVDRTWDKDNGSGTFQRTNTGPTGNTRSANGTVTRSEDRSISTDGSYQRRDGSSGTFATTTQRTESGRISSGTYTNAQGNTGSINRNTVRDGRTSTTTTTATAANGLTRTAATTTTIDNGTATRTHTATNPEGETRSHTVTVTKVQPAP